jgi:hypothetical protein
MALSMISEMLARAQGVLPQSAFGALLLGATQTILVIRSLPSEERQRSAVGDHGAQAAVILAADVAG